MPCHVSRLTLMLWNVRSTQDELAIPWQQLRANSARQRAASMSAVHAAVDGVWRQLKSQCSKVSV